jgi:hypothetical protein
VFALLYCSGLDTADLKDAIAFARSVWRDRDLMLALPVR